MSLSSEPSTAIPAPRPLAPAVAMAIERLYPDCASRYDISPDRFLQIVTLVVTKYAGDAPEASQLQLLEKLHVEELVLARGCSAGNEAAWTVFLNRFRAPLYESAYRIAGNDATGREIADELYADLYGIPRSDGHRVSKLDYYMGRGSLEGWLRTVLAQHHIDRCRSHAKTVSLEEQIEFGASFPDRAQAATPPPDPRLAVALNQVLDELPAEDSFLLASYYLDQQTLAQLARTLHVHESTISRRLDRLTTQLRRNVIQHMRATGLKPRQCDELLDQLDVRDLNLDLHSKLRQESTGAAFYNKNGSAS